MLDISVDTKIFVYCPADVVTGGAELLHQLVDLLNNKGLNAYIIYYGKSGATVPKAYSVYTIKVAEQVEDEAKNIVVFYEAAFDRIKELKNSQIFLWWLSVDNFYIFGTNVINIRDLCRFDFLFGLRVAMSRCFQLLFKGNNLFRKTFSLSWLTKLNAVNAYQSEYAQNFLINHGFKLTTPLSDYINTDFYKGFSTENRKNSILYNPKKGLAFTKKLIAHNPNLNWIPLENMNREDLVKVFNESKLYVDFGYHPGKDRLPREVALNGCCVITGMRGSARFFEDVSLMNEYKFNQSSASISSIVEKIEDVLTHYEDQVMNFDLYRKQILDEKRVFEEQVNKIFKIRS